jgi:hypothetical protein
MSTAAVDVQGLAEIEAMLAQFKDPLLTKRAQRATRKGANVLARPLRSAARRLSKRMAKSVWVHIAKRDRPAMVVGHHRRDAYFWHMVIGGTKEHGTRRGKVLDFIPGWNKYKGTPAPTRGYVTTKRVRGVPAHPIVAQVAGQYGQAAMDAIANDLGRDE